MSLVDRDDSVLVVIDTQPGFLDKLDEDNAAAIVVRVQWLVSLAGELGVPVVVTEEEPEDNGATHPDVGSVLPAEAARHVKPQFGLAACPQIVADLKHTGRGTAVLCGLETDVCVAQSAIGLAGDGRWRVVVLEDAVASPGSGHRQGLRRLRDEGVEILGIKSLAYDWIRSVELANRVLGLPALAAPPGVTL
jgi:nicotinamidase-related amidase